jgi:hypothetical protein
MTQARITNANLLLVEGNDDENFITEFLAHERINNIDIINCKGNAQFADNIQASINYPGFSVVQKYGVILDADGNHAGKFASISGALTRAGLTPPTDSRRLSTGRPQIGVFTFPSLDRNGMLEDLCLDSISSSPAMVCVNAFAACTSKLHPAPTNPSKSKAQAFLAAMEESVPNVGIAARRRYWDYASDSMNDLRNFLRLFA